MNIEMSKGDTEILINKVIAMTLESDIGVYSRKYRKPASVRLCRAKDRYRDDLTCHGGFETVAATLRPVAMHVLVLRVMRWRTSLR